jgi:CRISPR system Cascade subunit CasE
MHLSLIRLDPRSRRAVTEAGRPYELHRSLLKAFPGRESGGPGRVLFRLDTDEESGGMSALVQSEKKPDWGKVNGAAGFIAEHKTKPFDPKFVQGQVLRFRLRANPTRRIAESGKRQGVLGEEAQIAWLRRKGEEGGFEVVDASVTREGLAADKMTDTSDRKHDLTMLAVRFDGLLRVVAPDAFRRTVEQGIGSAKGFGFGLLSIAPVRRE